MDIYLPIYLLAGNHRSSLFPTTRALVKNDSVRGIQSIAQTDRVHDCILDMTVFKAKALKEHVQLRHMFMASLLRIL